MASVTYDGRSFMLDGRRVWIAGGSIHYARLPRAEWAGRIAAAKQAGLNTVETPVVWSRHEARAGQFDFTGDNDLRHFVQLVGEAGMHLVLRVGPFVGSGYDAGGIPAWLLAQATVEPRTGNGPFLEACSRYITALAGQVKDLQVTSPGKGGPILLVQSEHAWTCGHDDLAHVYLGELLRYLREAGLSVPVINANSLWQSVEGEIECWSGASDLLSISRQLVEVHPRHPRLIADLRLGEPTVWGKPEPQASSGEQIVRATAEALAGVSQFVLNPFAGGQTFGFGAGRLPGDADGFMTTRHDNGAIVKADGERTPAYSVVRRIAMFAGRFGKVLAHLDPDDRPVAVLPSMEGGPTVVPIRGTQGSVVFVFGEPHKRGRSVQNARLLLRDGSILDAPVGSCGTSWCLFDVLIGSRAQLDYCSLCAFAVVGNVLVCFGPAGSTGVVSINGSPLEAAVPAGKTPEILQHEGVRLVIANEEQLDAIQITDDGVLVGVIGFDEKGGPIATPGGRKYTLLTPDGKSAERTAESVSRRGTPSRQLAASWEMAGTEEYVSGASPRYAAITGPSSLSSLGAPYGYGWYRMRFRSTVAKRVRIAAPQAADRLAVFLDGEPVGMFGRGPGAGGEITLQLKKTDHTLVILAENLGRPSGGQNIKPRKGLFGDLYELAAFRAGRSKTVEGAPVELMSFRAPLWEVRRGDVTHPERVAWSFVHRKKSPVIIRLGEVVVRGLVILNGKPIHFFEPGADNDLALDQDSLNRGNNTIELAVAADSVGEAHLAEALAELARSTTFLEGKDTLGAKVDWAFAQWEPPAPTAFDPITRAPTGPVWYQAEFETPEPDRNVILTIAGLSKGQFYLNGRHVGRYFVASGGKAVPPQTEYLLPRSWMYEDGPNELRLFDEHGGDPTKCTLAAVRKADGT
ncbi:MAG: beta-galactosidase [Phycisphaerales bacterium]|nr:beta-galactosidase [Phycisphaerales bacterium]